MCGGVSKARYWLFSTDSLHFLSFGSGFCAFLFTYFFLLFLSLSSRFPVFSPQISTLGPVFCTAEASVGGWWMMDRKKWENGKCEKNKTGKRFNRYLYQITRKCFFLLPSSSFISPILNISSTVPHLFCIFFSFCNYDTPHPPIHPSCFLFVYLLSHFFLSSSTCPNSFPAHLSTRLPYSFTLSPIPNKSIRPEQKIGTTICPFVLGVAFGLGSRSDTSPCSA